MDLPDDRIKTFEKMGKLSECRKDQDCFAPLVSILVPVYKVEKYIERCARSLFEQTYSNLEFVFVDDASPDKSVEILQQVITPEKGFRDWFHRIRGHGAAQSACGPAVIHPCR